MNYHELKFKRSRLWNQYMTAIQAGKPATECQDLFNQYDMVNQEYLKEVRRK